MDDLHATRTKAKTKTEVKVLAPWMHAHQKELASTILPLSVQLCRHNPHLHLHLDLLLWQLPLLLHLLLVLIAKQSLSQTTGPICIQNGRVLNILVTSNAVFLPIK
jgi:hypothetical protein